MINITVHKTDKTFDGFVVEGHAGYDEEGRDIICAAISILSTAALNSMNLVASIPEKNIIFDVDENTGFMKLHTLENNDKSDVIYRNFIVGVQLLLENYGDYITLKFEEV